jgi:hypothetical protein
MSRSRRSGTKRRKHRGGGVFDSISSGFESVKNAFTGKSSAAPLTAGEQLSEKVVPSVAPAALNAGQKVADKLPSIANGGASKSLGLPSEKSGYTSTGGRRRFRKTRRRKY